MADDKKIYLGSKDQVTEIQDTDTFIIATSDGIRRMTKTRVMEKLGISQLTEELKRVSGSGGMTREEVSRLIDEKGDMVVTLSYDDNGNIVADKTFEEILEVYESKEKRICCVYDDEYYFIRYYLDDIYYDDDDKICRFIFKACNTTSSMELGFHLVHINSDNSVDDFNHGYTDIGFTENLNTKSTNIVDAVNEVNDKANGLVVDMWRDMDDGTRITRVDSSFDDISQAVDSGLPVRGRIVGAYDNGREYVFDDVTPLFYIGGTSTAHTFMSVSINSANKYYEVYTLDNNNSCKRTESRLGTTSAVLQKTGSSTTDSMSQAAITAELKDIRNTMSTLTTEEVNELIDTKLGVIENGSY